MADIETELMKGEELLASQDYEKARKKFGDVIKADPGCSRAYYWKAEASLGVPKVPAEEIMELYKKAWELEPDNVFLLTTLGEFCTEIGKFNDAETYYNKATEIDEENACQYFAEFAIAYYRKAPVHMEKFLDDKTWLIIKKKSLTYMLKALDMSPEAARKLLE
jgi:tetratricopeptide (TPR) repeat protein